MKKVFLFVSSLCLAAFLVSYIPNSSNEQNRSEKQLSLSTLDSLQGIWINERDTSNIVTINNRTWVSTFPDDNTIISDTAIVFFSDTIIAGDTILYTQIDTTSVTGNYIVHVLPLDNGQGFEGVGCWEILGITVIEGETFFSIWPAPYGTAGSTQVFRKSN